MKSIAGIPVVVGIAATFVADQGLRIFVAIGFAMTGRQVDEDGELLIAGAYYILTAAVLLLIGAAVGVWERLKVWQASLIFGAVVTLSQLGSSLFDPEPTTAGELLLGLAFWFFLNTLPFACGMWITQRWRLRRNSTRDSAPASVPAANAAGAPSSAELKEWLGL